MSELWCNGNTADFGSVVLGSSPGSSTHKGTFSGAFVVFCIDWHSHRLLLKWMFCTFEQAQLHTSILTPSMMVCQSIKKLCCREMEGLPRSCFFLHRILRLQHSLGDDTQLTINCVTFESLGYNIGHSLRLLLKWKSCILEQAQLHTSILTPSAMVCQSIKKLCCREMEGLPRSCFSAPHPATAALPR